MSFGNKDQQIPAAPPVETNHESQKKTKISYSRDFLLAFRDSDDCQKFPAGFDQSLISEFGDTSQDRQRISGGLSLQSSRHSEYGSSPPIRGDSSNYSQGIRGRWESRSSGRSDKGSDLKSDWDSDSGRRYGSNQSRRSWQVPDHDGLLGSGSFPRPSGYAAGASASRSQTNDHYQLNRSNEPYHPPRPYKAVPHSRKETDLYNDETFGISESPSEDRAEEERKRRASFELMRKEQQRAFQEKQKLNPDKHNNDFDITTLLEDSKDEKKILNRNNESDEPLILPATNNDSEKSSFSSQTSASRPLVPPGFTTTVLERNFGTKPLVHPHSAEAVNAVFGNSLLHTKGKCELNENSSNQVEKQSTEHMDLNRQQLGTTGIHLSFDSKGEKIPKLSSALDISSETVGMGSQSDHLSEVFEASEIGEAVEFDVEKVIGNKIVGKSNQDHSNSILDKLFGGALTLNGGGSRIIEHQGNKEDDLWNPNTVHSSKFARWFLEDEKKPIDERSSGQSNDLLSLIVGGEKGKSQVPNAKTTELIPSKLLLQNSELAERHMASDIPVTDGNFEKFYNNKSEGVPAVLTCEDLEQSILSEISEKGSTEKKASTLQLRVPGWSIFDVKSEQPKNNIDDRASQHLLSLLQKGTDSNDMTPFPNLENSFSDKEHNIEAASISTGLDKSRDAKVEIGLNSSKTLTLETLFGTAFMKELQSVGAPVSVQRGSGGASGVGDSEPHGLPIPVMDDGILPSFLGEIGYNTTSHESSDLESNQIPQTKMSKIEEQWLDLNDSRAAMDSSKFQSEIGSKHFVDRPPDIRLPEEDSLITVSNPANLQHFMPARNPAKPEFLSFPNTSGDIAEKLAALNWVFKDEKPNVVQEGPPFLLGPFDTREADIPYQNLHVQPSSQLHPPQLNHAGPLFQPLDTAHPAHKNSQMKFMAQEGIFHHEPPPSHRLPANMTHHPPFHQPSAGLTGFDPPPHHPMLQPMHMPGNFPPSHLLRGFPRGALMPPHPSNQVTAMQGLPFSPRPSNFGDLGMPPLASDGGSGGRSNHPEAYRRLIEMELRSNSKQFHLFAPGGHSQGMYEMGFGHR